LDSHNGRFPQNNAFALNKYIRIRRSQVNTYILCEKA